MNGLSYGLAVYVYKEKWIYISGDKKKCKIYKPFAVN
jgi:hypothetical protein